MTLYILGTEYEVLYRREDDDPKLKKCAGYMDNSTKKIVVCEVEPDEMSLSDLTVYSKKVLRHEIIHAYLYESGLCDNSNTAETWGQNEEMIDWIAIQAPKMLQSFKEANAL